MNKYLAKSDPEETIQQHTDKLLKNLELIKSIYPDLDINWQLLRVASLYHDLGKMNLKFQSKINGGKKYSDEVAHNLLSLAFLDKNELKKQFSEQEIKILAHAIAYHHERGDYEASNYNEEVEALKAEAEKFVYDKVKITTIKKISPKYFSNDRIYENSGCFFDYVKIKGLLNRLDYAASADIDVEIKNDFMCEKLENLKYNWNELQRYMIENREKNVVVVAQTGMGKTEAGLLWIGNNKGFFTLPLKTAINNIYKRFTEKIVGIENKELIGLLHSDTYSKYIENATDDEDIDEYFTKTKQLSLPITVCTLDQLFDFVFKYKGFEIKLATLSYSKIVIDEVQMYSPDLLAYLIIGLSYISKIGGKFAILTATLPGIVTDLLKEQLRNTGVSFEQPKPFINDQFIRHSIKIIDESINSSNIIEKYDGNNKILVICNTVKTAQKIYDELKNDEEFSQKCKNINLFHSRFIKKDRKEKEDEIVRFGKADCNESGIWITTQVVEASLDIDFDILFTELSDINGLFQRMGRCYRNRVWDKEGYNCYVFIGGNKKCSGVGEFIDEKIFEFSKEELKNIDGIMTETEKQKMIEKVYNTDKLKDTDYYNKVLKNIEYVQSFNGYEKNKEEVKKMFRNICNITILPSCVYDANKTEIDNLVSKIQNESDKKERRKLIDDLNGFTLDVNYYEVEKEPYSVLRISKHMEIPIYENFEYDNCLGLRRKSKNQSDDFKVNSSIL
ncbi:CRISPR-associated helicase/endonuclease Cas3 [Acetivibrio clariflavus]|uniref:CRISPR-associated helicase, Cas3 family n=1 Tax=Acetivibrio clariflavus (strain DSM 19732 / NBRC 101661 / EBR45) TaxID=720554 RepID=G8M1G9_ACECE|nr:CRISPR-associated helicase/endonuclease Cas3 [Acetivibrio clariflavus]AEV69184.1 CRISPR-associated helicase, Cas3 family [Acetivibrio clariflavus DSM 19732]